MNPPIAILAFMTVSFGGLVAQATGSAPDDSLNIITLVTQLGLSGVFLWQWRKSETIREKLTEQLLDLSREVFPMVSAATATMEHMDDSTGRSADALTAVMKELNSTVADLRAVADHTRRSTDRDRS